MDWSERFTVDFVLWLWGGEINLCMCMSEKWIKDLVVCHLQLVVMAEAAAEEAAAKCT